MCITHVFIGIAKERACGYRLRQPILFGITSLAIIQYPSALRAPRQPWFYNDGRDVGAKGCSSLKIYEWSTATY